LEDKVDVKIKAEEQRKKAEKELEAQAEENRINTIKDRIDTFETDSYKIIQATTFDDIELNKTMLDALANTEFDFEEYDILFEQAKARVQASWDSKCTDVKQREEQRLENERMKQEIMDVRIQRLLELGVFVIESENKLSSLDYIFQNKDKTFEKSAETIFLYDAAMFQKTTDDIRRMNEKAEQSKRDAEIKKQKDEQFEVRKNRLSEIGFGITQNEHFFFCREFSSISISVDSVYNASVTEFEEIMSKAKQDVIDAEKQKEADDKKERFEKRKLVLLDLGFLYNENAEYNFSHKYWSCFHEQVDDNTDEWFEEYLVDIKNAISKGEVAERKKADAENKARVKRLAKDKESIQNALTLIKDTVIGEIVFRKYDNEETEAFRAKLEVDFDKFIDDCSTQLNEL